MLMLAFATCFGFTVRWVRRLCLLAAVAVACGVARSEAFDGVAEPLWTTYALTDALFWGRDNQAANNPLVTTVNDGVPVISGKDLQFPFSQGVRAFYGQRQPCECGWELGYWGLYGQSATQVAGGTPANFIQMPEPIGSRLTADAENAVVKYASTINSAEANVFSTRHEWRDYSGSWLTDDWLLGFRYVGVDEQASIFMTCCPEDLPANYRVRTSNNMFGAQVGRRMRWTWDRWAIEGWAKAGLLGNSQLGIQDPLIDYTGFQQRPGYSTWGSSVGFIGDINLSTVYRLTDVWGIRAGYNLIWIDGLALAPNQFNFAVADNAGSALVSGGGVFLNGANLGLEARW
ncbi:MAG: hypothetical protein EBS56_05695 [Planctomycetia bacterium]|nr:hypothetical protein [Planctomycetia bacterium]